MSSLYIIARRFSKRFYSITCRSYPLVQAGWRHNQQYLNFSPSNHLRTFIHFQNKGFGFSSWASNRENTAAAKSNENAEESEDMVKLVSEQEELLIVKRQKEIDNMKDKILRTLAAETENVKERTRREADNMKKFAIQNFAKGLLDVADSLSEELLQL